MESSVKFQKICQIEGRRYILLVGMVALTYLMLQSLMLPSNRLDIVSGNESRIDPSSLDRDRTDSDAFDEVTRGVQDNSSVKSEGKGEGEGEGEGEGGVIGLSKDGEIDRSTLERDQTDFDAFDEVTRDVQDNTNSSVKSERKGESEVIGLSKDGEIDRSTLDRDQADSVAFDEVARDVQDNTNISVKSEGKGEDEVVGFSKDGEIESDLGLVTENSSIPESDKTGQIEQITGSLESNTSSSSDGNEYDESDLALLSNELDLIRTHRRHKIRDGGEPPKTVIPVEKMNHMLARYLASSSKMKPRRSSLRDRDKEILDAKFQIINSAPSNVDKELYAPVFRNVSMFMRSYELMEQTLKVYVYKDGKRPIFHQPILKGLYASEGWFMKLMEGSKNFSVKKPERAHLFYMPFSSRELEHALYVPDSHNRTSLRQFVKDYKDMLAAKYPFWNKSGGTDHFFVACHDWAPFETAEHLESNIKVLCNADVTIGFRIGRDVSLPETFIRYPRNPLRYRGGKPASQRTILAFYAGNTHGYLRPILQKHWKSDPDMRIYGLLPVSVSRRLNYIQHMKTSKYCICPKGFEVNSPRVVEAIFYECVPVIISDNFVPPFFDVLDWGAFSVFVPEKDIPDLKRILTGIPEKKYRELQMGVKMVQKHFLWHARPVKYDLFHMILHSVWFSRVFQV